MFNDNLSMPNSCEVIFRAISKTTINGVEYDINEPILTMSQVGVTINFGNNSKVATGKHTLLHYQEAPATSLSIIPSSFQSNTYKLIGSKLDATNIPVPVKESIQTDENGEAFLQPVDTSNSIFIYDVDGNKVTGYTIEYETQITGLNPYSEYLIVYYTSKEFQDYYNLIRSFTKYIKLEIKTTGNSDNQSSNMLITIDKVSPSITPQVLLSGNEMWTVPLNFVIIDQKVKVVVY